MTTEEKIVKTLRKIKWPKGFLCPDCGSKRIYQVNSKGKIKKYYCKDCLKSFSDISQTIFQKTRIPLTKWLESFEMFQKDPDITARQLKNDLEISYTAARRMRRILVDNRNFTDRFLNIFKKP